MSGFHKMKYEGLRLDSWMNTLTGINTTRDKMTYGSFGAGVRVDDATADLMFHEDDVASWICEAMPQYALRKGFSAEVKPDKDDQDKDMVEDLKETEAAINDEKDRLGLEKAIEDAVVWANVFGGAAILPVFESGAEGPQLLEPLDEANIQGIVSLNVIDRRYIQPMSWYDDPGQAKFGTPRTYLITPFAMNSTVSVANLMDTAGVYEVHESRLIIFGGMRTSTLRRQNNNGWEDSLLTRVNYVLKSYGLSWAVLPNLVSDGNQAVYKMRGYIDALSADEPGLINDRMQLIDMTRSVSRAVVLDAEDEDFSRAGFNFGGLNIPFELLERRVSTAARTPATILFGRSPAGENATGEADFQNFDSQVEHYQRMRMRSQATRVIELICMGKDGPTAGKVPENMDVTFPKLRSLTPKEEAEIRQIQSVTDKNYVDSAVLEPEEVALSRFGPNGYTIETTINTDSRVAPETPEEYEEKHQPLDLGDGDGENTDKDAPGATGDKDNE